MDTQRHGRAELCATARSTARTVIDFQFLWMGAAPLSLPAMMATAVERRGNRSEAHVPPLSVSAGPNTSAIILGNPDPLVARRSVADDAPAFCMWVGYKPGSDELRAVQLSDGCLSFRCSIIADLRWLAVQ